MSHVHTAEIVSIDGVREVALLTDLIRRGSAARNVDEKADALQRAIES